MVRYNTVRYDKVRYNMIRYDKIQYEHFISDKKPILLLENRHIDYRRIKMLEK